MEAKRLAILGLARSGRAAAELALSRGVSVFASDGADSAELRAAASAIRRAGGEAELGTHSIEKLAECDQIVVSPGIAPDSPVLADERIKSLPRVSELEFAFQYLRAPVIAVTGTNGKSTTTVLIAHLLQQEGYNAPAAGNIGTALSDVALHELSPDWVVVEASSFQLADIATFAPQIGVLTNLAPDHLDRYPTVEAYYADKARIFENASSDSSWVINGEDAEVLRLAHGRSGHHLLFRINSEPEANERGAYLRSDGMLCLREDNEDRELLPAADITLLGAHNRANALAAALAARVAGVAVSRIVDGLRSFRGLEHRLERITERDGVEWINDSKATNVASTLVAIRSMTRPTLLLLGGRHKGEAYTALIPDLQQHVRTVLAYGEAAEQIEHDLGNAIAVERVNGTFDTVVARAAESARPGEAVLLSPACASFDMFRNYEERGRRFRELAMSSAGAGHGT